MGRRNFRARAADFAVGALSELVDVVRYGLPCLRQAPDGSSGRRAREHRARRPVALVGAAVGEDAAAVAVGEAEVWYYLHPITLATDSLARYAVLVTQRCGHLRCHSTLVLATLLFPRVPPSEILAVIRELAESCEPWGISLCGGHTEIRTPCRDRSWWG